MTDSKTLSRIRIVLVNTTHPSNIGAAARAMKNMGLSQLYLVKPLRPVNERSLSRAGHALDVLDAAVYCDTLEQALVDCRTVIGTSARERGIGWQVQDVRQSAIRAVNDATRYPVAIVFGREDRGLTNEEMQKCHWHLSIPTNPDYSALNIAAAVQVVCYELRMAMLEAQHQAMPVSEASEPVTPASADAMELFYQHLESVLDEIDYLKPARTRQTMLRLRRIYNRAQMDELELAMQRGILKAVEWAVRPVKDHEPQK